MIYDLLYDWQKKLVNQIKNKRSYGLFLDMGLGKTPISLALCEQNQVDKILIITINSKAQEKETEEGSWLWWVKKMEKPYLLSTKKTKGFSASEPEVLLINYEWLASKEKSFCVGVQLRTEILRFLDTCKNKKVAIILDESHKIKSSQSLQTKCVQKIWAILKSNPHSYLYLLTGTPFTQGYIDLYTQLKLLGAPLNKEQFKENFCIMDDRPGLLGWQQPIKAYKNVEQLYQLIHHYAITIKSNEVVSLPEQLFVNHTYPSTSVINLFTKENPKKEDFKTWLIKSNLPYPQEDRNVYFRNIDYPNFEWEADTSAQFWLRTRELSIGFQGNSEIYKVYDRTRFNLLEKFLKENEDNYLLFYSYTPEFIELYNLCDKLGYKIDVYNGIIKDIRFYEEYSKLNEGQKLIYKKKNIILANWSSGSTGINFQSYNKCIVFDLPVYKDWEQGIKRIHRIGQKSTCIYHIFTQSCWLDKNMWKAIEEQRDYTKDTFESDLERVQDVLK